MTHTHQYLLRVWGRDREQVEELLSPNSHEPGKHCACWWFPSKRRREEFLARIPYNLCVMMKCVNPNFKEEDGETINTQRLTYANATLLLPDGTTKIVRECLGYGYSPSAAEYSWHEGNMSCDCNRARLLGLCEEEEDYPCGNTITLLNLSITTEPPDPLPHALPKGMV